jgi:multidrug efflux pump
MSSPLPGAAPYVNDFIQNGRVKKVYLQSEPRYRIAARGYQQLVLRNKDGEMVPFFGLCPPPTGSMVSPRLERYNGIPSVEIMGQAAPGVSTGEAMAEMEKMAAQLPTGIGYEWTGLSYEEKQAGKTGPCPVRHLDPGGVSQCGALYESWTIPSSIC